MFAIKRMLATVLVKIILFCCKRTFPNRTFFQVTGLPGNKLAQVWHFLDCFRRVMECYWCFVSFLQRFTYIVYIWSLQKPPFLNNFFSFHTTLAISISGGITIKESLWILPGILTKFDAENILLAVPYNLSCHQRWWQSS